MKQQVKRRFCVAGYPGDSGKNMILDLKNRNDTILIDNVWGENIGYKRWYDAYCERKRRIGFKQLWNILRRISWFQDWFYKLFQLSNIQFDEDCENYLLMINSGLCSVYTKQYLMWLRRRKPNVHFILYQMDPTDLFYSRLCEKSVLDVFDLIYNISYDDSKKYGHQYWPLILSKREDLQKIYNVSKIQRDLYFCGWGADRAECLQEIYQAGMPKEIKTQFLVYYSDIKKYNGVKFINKPISYNENIRNIMQCGCLLELMHEGYTNATQRYPEAVIYNKKLLSNNDAIRNFPYYDERYMKIFHDVSEIDWDWLKRPIEVDYQYKGDFSPDKLLEDIIRQYEEND